MGLWRRRSGTRAVGALGALVLAGGLALGVGNTAHAEAPDTAEGAAVAVERKLGERGAELGVSTERDRLKVDVGEESAGWARGTAVITTERGSDEHPRGWVFHAHEGANGWEVAFDGEPRFAALAGESTVATKAERQAASSERRAEPRIPGDLRTGMALPYATGQAWTMHGGPHGWAGSDSPWSALDLSGGDEKVRATRAGTAYTMCKGWVRVIHDRGYATDYYHLWNNISVNGAPVSEGTYLGDTGTDVTCGGSALGRHVHIGLRHNDAYTAIGNHNLGKWVLQNGGAPYAGSALHGSTRVGTGGALHNYGALGFTQGVVDTNGGSTLTRRSGPGSGHSEVGSVADGTTVTISCSSQGTSHSGRWGGSSLWNRLSDGSWVSDAYLWTGLNGPVNGDC